ncbi:MAG: hypothetical protein HYT77_02255 [Deltaproteobacteria bacterium]|nr:hypothetical protein [Deltaproteobacteria bacterium]
MNPSSFVKSEPIDLKNSSEFSEKWLQEKIAEDPSILGLGDLILKDKERIQPGAGRLDLLLQDPEDDRRYEVEIQLGKTDETHIIRTIEYWDIERKRYPQYDHCAVIIAEDITSRFLNVINLFNSHIPLIAIQMNAWKVGNQTTITFTTVMDLQELGLEEEDQPSEATDRAYWEKRGSKITLEQVDEIERLIQGFASGYKLKYNKFYIGLAKDGQPLNFTVIRPRKTTMNIDIKLPQSKEIDEKIESLGLDMLAYEKRYGNYRLRLTKEDLEKNKDALVQLIRSAWEKMS